VKSRKSWREKPRPVLFRSARHAAAAEGSLRHACVILSPEPSARGKLRRRISLIAEILRGVYPAQRGCAPLRGHSIQTLDSEPALYCAGTFAMALRLPVANISRPCTGMVEVTLT
jgi:hypothetical protein